MGDANKEIGARLGRSAGRFVRTARKAARTEAPELADRARDIAQPAAERLARFAQEHDEELRQAGIAGARLVASRLAPPVAQPVITALAAKAASRLDTTAGTPSGDREQDRT